MTDEFDERRKGDRRRPAKQMERYNNETDLQNMVQSGASHVHHFRGTL